MDIFFPAQYPAASLLLVKGGLWIFGSLSGSPAAVHYRSTTGIFLETSAEPEEKPPDLSDAAALHLFAFDFQQLPNPGSLF